MTNVTVQEALKAAIEALEDVFEEENITAITAINQCKAALTELEKCEPVGQVVNANDEIPGIGTYGHMHIELPNETKLYDKPQPREWVGLSDDDITALYNSMDVFVDYKDFAEVIISKLKQLNTKG